MVYEYMRSCRQPPSCIYALCSDYTAASGSKCSANLTESEGQYK